MEHPSAKYDIISCLFFFDKEQGLHGDPHIRGQLFPPVFHLIFVGFCISRMTELARSRRSRNWYSELAFFAGARLWSAVCEMWKVCLRFRCASNFYDETLLVADAAAAISVTAAVAAVVAKELQNGGSAVNRCFVSHPRPHSEGEATASDFYQNWVRAPNHSTRQFE